MRESAYDALRSGVIFKSERGKLYQFTPNSISVLRIWPFPLAGKKTRGKPAWIYYRPVISVPAGDIQERIRLLETNTQPDGQILLPFPLSPQEARVRQAKLAWLRAHASIPAEIRNLIAPFPERQWHLLSFLARCGRAAVDLTRSNPALAWALASSWVFHKPPVQRPLRSARRLIRKKQRHILSWLGFPETEEARKVMAKVTHGAIRISPLLYMRQAMTDPSMLKAMNHLSRLNAGVIRIVTDSKLLPFASPALLEEVAHNPKEENHAGAANWLRDCIDMQAQLFPDARRPHPLRNMKEMHAWHDTLLEEGRRQAWPRFIDAPFPAPPVEGTDDIVPITNASELIQEGDVMHNCVAAYGERIAIQKWVYVYRVLKPERCTLALSRRGSQWALSDIRRACNQPPSKATCRVVENWLGCQGKAVTRPSFSLDPEEVPF